MSKSKQNLDALSKQIEALMAKYMPDEVGIEVDHIIPIAKGGKTVPSNLQVLCSKCNGSKHDKV